jgi:diguanylate cyclase (GGDEF)-like protein
MPDVDHVDVVLVDDDPSQRLLIARLLERAGLTLASACGVEEGFRLLKRTNPKVALVDYRLGPEDGMDLCRRIRADAEHAGTYLVLITSEGEPGMREAAIELGVDDYLEKPLNQHEVVSRVRVGSRMWALHRELRRAAITDGLTTLYNHDHFNRVLEQEVHRARRYGHPLSVMMIDVDHFKAINDTVGHLVGNTVLERIAAILRENARGMDIIARFGGEEFAVVLPESKVADACVVAERMRRAIEDADYGDEVADGQVTASFGVADSDDERALCAARLVDLADRAMYLAKHRGRNQVASAGDLEEGREPVHVVRDDEVDSLRRRLASLSLQARDVYCQSVASLVQALDERDPYSASHARNVAAYAEQLARELRCSAGLVKAIQNAALLHDIGKVGIPDMILMKPHPLSRLEKVFINQVPVISTRIVDHLRILESEVQIIRHQREYFDGSGTPNGLIGNQIPIGARILLVADAFDALTTDRIYRERCSIGDAVAELQRHSGRQFDPDVVAALCRVLDAHRPEWESRIHETVESLQLPPALAGRHAGK